MIMSNKNYYVDYSLPFFFQKKKKVPDGSKLNSNDGSLTLQKNNDNNNNKRSFFCNIAHVTGQAFGPCTSSFELLLR